MPSRCGAGDRRACVLRDQTGLIQFVTPGPASYRTSRGKLAPSSERSGTSVRQLTPRLNRIMDGGSSLPPFFSFEVSGTGTARVFRLPILCKMGK